jgi:hypothetical protein
VQAPIPESCALRRMRLQSREDSHVRRARPTLIPPRGGTEPDHATRPSQTRAARLQPPHRLTPSDGAYH